MQRGKSTVSTTHKRKVWRISAAAPLGEFVDPSLPVARNVPSAADATDGIVVQQGWQNSSFELMHGVEVSEEDPSTVPAELFDELFKPSKK